LPAAEAIIRRGLEIFILAFLFRIQGFIVSPGNHVVTLFRVDILNIMGPSIAAAGVVWALASTPARRVVLFAALATAIGQSGATALAAVAGQETMLTDPATFGRLILSFHKSYSVKSATSAQPRVLEIPKNRNAGAYQRTFECQGWDKSKSEERNSKSEGNPMANLRLGTAERDEVD
jgi:hypothetical protein